MTRINDEDCPCFYFATCPDEGSVKPTPGLTALEAARRHGISVICGHTHRAGQSEG